MSRIDDAFRRLAGVVSAEPRTTSMLDRYASEGAPSVEKARNAHWAQEPPRVTKFSPPASRPIEARPASPAPSAHALSHAEAKADLRTARRNSVRNQEAPVASEPGSGTD